MRVPLPTAAPLSSRSANATTMPADKQHNHVNNNNRPLVPMLGKPPLAKPPLTPRVAASTARPVSTPTPSYRKEATKEETSPPVSSFLSTNITPRSAARKSRVDSTSSTPTGTPVGTPVPTSNEYRTVDGASVSAFVSVAPGAVPPAEASKRPTVSFEPILASNDRFQKSPEPQQANDASKFFYASDARSAPQKQARPPSQKAATFFYANGGALPTAGSSSSSAVGSSYGDDARTQSKFFHANGVPEKSAPAKSPPLAGYPTRLSNAPASMQAFSPPPRPVSPAKPAQLAIPMPMMRPNLAPLGRGQSLQAPVAPRASFSTPSPSHGRSGSLSSTDGISATRPTSQPVPMETLPPLPLQSAFSAGSLAAAIISTSVEIDDSDSADETQSHRSALHSPTKAETGELQDLAATARTERKVLDLEIRNSSLTAINRTLEREMRKQAAELRRYRRLSRSGRLSLNTTDSAVPLSSLSEEDESDFESDASSSVSSMDDEALSPSAQAERDARLQARDEKRLALDLSKHQQLLTTSQQMNQSLKRCLGLTEDLIKDANKALAFNVRPSDVEIGGRVLAPDEVEAMYKKLDLDRPLTTDPLHESGLAPAHRDAIDAVHSLMDDVLNSQTYVSY